MKNGLQMPPANWSMQSSTRTVVRSTDCMYHRSVRPINQHGCLLCLPLLHIYVTPAVQALQDYFDNSWMLTESLFAGLQGEDAFMRPPLHGLRHPMIFYYGHPATLYVNKFRAAGILKVRTAAIWTSLVYDGERERGRDKERERARARNFVHHHGSSYLHL